MTMDRPILSRENVSNDAAKAMASYHSSLIHEVSSAVSQEKVVIIGMAQNPHVVRVRKALTDEGVTFKYLEYGSYFSKWRQRLAIKLWSGWPTFPQVFVDGVLIGGATDTLRAIKTGRFKN